MQAVSANSARNSKRSFVDVYQSYLLLSRPKISRATQRLNGLVGEITTFHIEVRPSRLLDRRGHQCLQLLIEHPGCRRDLLIAELPEERRWIIVLNAGLALIVLVDQDSQRCVQAGPDVVLGHL